VQAVQCRQRERRDPDGADPQPLDHPRLQCSEPAKPEERPHREEVTGRLLLQQAEILRIPQGKGVGEERRGVHRQIELGVGDDLARRRHEREDHEQQGESEQPDPAPHQFVHGMPRRASTAASHQRPLDNAVRPTG
jgi:hypothetical protein